MRLKKGIGFCGIAFMMLTGVCLAKGTVAHASNDANVLLNPDETYQYDVTEDGVTDQVKVKIVDNKDKDDSATITIFVNEQVAFEQKREAGPYWNVNLIRLENGKVFFDIYSTILSDDACIHQLYSCEDGKLKSVYDFQKYYARYGDYYLVNVEEVSGNAIKASVMAQFFTTGSIRFDMTLRYEDGKFRTTSDTFALKYEKGYRKNKWTANRKIKVYRTAGSKRRAYTLKKGNVIKLSKVVYKDHKVYFKIRNSKGKNGYIAAAKKYSYTHYFKEAQYAG